MRAEYSFEIEPARRLLVLRMSGFFDVEAMEALNRARHHAHIALGCAPNTHHTLMDIRNTHIRCASARATFDELLNRKQQVAKRISLIVSESAPATSGITLDAAKTRCFSDPAEAEAWLFADPRQSRLH